MRGRGKGLTARQLQVPGEVPSYSRPRWRADLAHAKHLWEVRWGQERAQDRASLGSPGPRLPHRSMGSWKFGFHSPFWIKGKVILYTILTSRVSL